MNSDEKAILDYLKGWPYTFVSAREIARKVGGKERYHADHGWAKPVLAQMVRLGLIDTDEFGHFRFKLEPSKKKRQKYVAPEILKILKRSGANLDGLNLDDDNTQPPIPPYRPPRKPSGPPGS